MGILNKAGNLCVWQQFLPAVKQYLNLAALIWFFFNICFLLFIFLKIINLKKRTICYENFPYASPLVTCNKLHWFSNIKTLPIGQTNITLQQTPACLFILRKTLKKKCSYLIILSLFFITNEIVYIQLHCFVA